MASPAVCSRCDIEALAFPFFSLALVLFFLKLIFLYEYVCDICNKCLVIICFLVVTPSPRMLTSTSVEEQLSRDPAFLLSVGLSVAAAGAAAPRQKLCASEA